MPPASTVKVVVRCKPKEDPTSDHLTPVDLPESPGNSTIILQKGQNPTDGLYQFNFTRVLDDKNQAEVYDVCGKSMVQSVLDGYNCTIMAYGQTGSGKTYTMTGPEGCIEDSELQGLVPRLVDQIFSELRRRRSQAVVTCSYIEIYNEQFRDLLNPDGNDADVGVTEIGKRMVLKGVKEPKIENAKQAIRYLMVGESQRHVAGHGMNTRSSRSHTIFTMLISSVAPSGKKLYSKLNLVDLAGSERADKTGVSGAAARESLYINKSLTFLEQVILALARKTAGHVPYRSSKLTHFLKDSLGGNCKTLLIANIWSSYAQINETISTCRFAHRMMQVTEDAHANHDGFNSVHGNLFKLDPVMQGYLETVTAAAVAREKAKLMAQFQRQGTEGQLTEHERVELNELRAKVQELEEMQEMTKMASEAARNGVVVDQETLEEMEMLRKRLLELEAENVVKSLDAPSASAREVEYMEEELHSLREQVVKLRQTRSMDSVEEEVERLRAQVREMQERELQRQASASSRDEGLWELSESELKELLHLKELRDRAREIQSKTGALEEHEVKELEQLREEVRKVAIGSPLKLAKRKDDETEYLRQRIKQLEAANALGYVSVNQAARPMTANYLAAPGPVSLCTDSEHGDVGSEAGTCSTDGEPKKKNTTFGKLRKGLSKVLRKGRSGSDSATPTPRHSNLAPAGRRSPSNAFPQTPEIPLPDGDPPNIVILNSLTRDQLNELLRATPRPPLTAREITGAFKAVQLPQMPLTARGARTPAQYRGPRDKSQDVSVIASRDM